MVILATRSREIGTNPLLDANCTFDANKDREFSIKIARCNWTGDMTFGNLVYVPDTEFGGIIEDILTDTSLDYVELKGYTWRGRMEMKVIEPPSGSDYKTVSGELNAVLKKLIEPEFGGLYVVSGESTGEVTKKLEIATTNKELAAKLPVYGTTPIIETRANSYKDTSVKFGKTFSKAPFVLLTLSGGSQNTKTFAVQVKDVSTTGMTIRTVNGYSSSVSMFINWCALPKGV